MIFILYLAPPKPLPIWHQGTRVPSCPPFATPLLMTDTAVGVLVVKELFS